MQTVFTMSLAYMIAICVVYGVYRLSRRRRSNATRVSHFKPTPWDTFRSRVVQGTGCQTVHEALRQGMVQSLPGGWLEFEDLAHHADETATVADLAQARLDAAMQAEPVKPLSRWTLDDRSELVAWGGGGTFEVGDESPTRQDGDDEPGWTLDYVMTTYPTRQEGDWVLTPDGDVRRVVNNPDVFNGECSPDSPNAAEGTLLRAAGTFEVGDEVRVGTQKTTHIAAHAVECMWTLVTPQQLRSPWVGRLEKRGKVVWVDGDTLTLEDGSTVAAADAELHWDDVRVGDNCWRLSTSSGRWGRPQPVVSVEGGRFHCKGSRMPWLFSSGDMFAPAGVDQA